MKTSFKVINISTHLKSRIKKKQKSIHRLRPLRFLSTCLNTFQSLRVKTEEFSIPSLAHFFVQNFLPCTAKDNKKGPTRQQALKDIQGL